MTIAVLFDFNGVLVDDEDVHFEAFRRALGAARRHISHDVYRRFLGYDDRRDARRAARAPRRAATSMIARWPRAVAKSRTAYARLAGLHPRLGFGARALVGRCARPAPAWRSSRRAAGRDRRRARRGALRDSFEVVWRRRTSRRGSPIPRAIGLARARLEAAAGRPLDAVAIEDAPAGLRAARAPAPAASAWRRPVPPRSSAARTRSSRRWRRSIRRASRGSDARGGRRRPADPVHARAGARAAAVTRALADPPCNYHRQDAFRALRAASSAT